MTSQESVQDNPPRYLVARAVGLLLGGVIGIPSGIAVGTFAADHLPGATDRGNVPAYAPPAPNYSFSPMDTVVPPSTIAPPVTVPPGPPNTGTVVRP